VLVTSAHDPPFGELLQPVVAEVQALQAGQRAEDHGREHNQVVARQQQRGDGRGEGEEGQGCERVVGKVQAAFEQPPLGMEELQGLQGQMQARTCLHELPAAHVCGLWLTLWRVGANACYSLLARALRAGALSRPSTQTGVIASTALRAQTWVLGAPAP